MWPVAAPPLEGEAEGMVRSPFARNVDQEEGRELLLRAAVASEELIGQDLPTLHPT